MSIPIDDRIEQAVAVQFADAMRRVAESEGVSLDRVMRVWRRMQNAATSPDMVHAQRNRRRSILDLAMDPHPAGGQL